MFQGNKLLPEFAAAESGTRRPKVATNRRRSRGTVRCILLHLLKVAIVENDIMEHLNSPQNHLASQRDDCSNSILHGHDHDHWGPLTGL